MKIDTTRQVSGRVVRCQILRKLRVVAACFFVSACSQTDMEKDWAVLLGAAQTYRGIFVGKIALRGLLTGRKIVTRRQKLTPTTSKHTFLDIKHLRS